jgi:acyl carrier protein
MSETRADDLATVVTKIWQEVLGVEGIGAEDGFFELGGDSLVATRLVARLREELGIAVSLLTIFDNPTLGELIMDLEAGVADRV